MSQLRSLDEYLRRGAHFHPERLAIKSVRNGESVTYAELDRLVSHFAGELVGHLPHGAPLGILLDDSIVGHAKFHAGMRAGLAMVPLDAELGDRTLRQCIAHAQIVHMVLAKNHPRLDVLEQIAGLTLDFYDPDLAAHDTAQADDFLSRASPDDLAILAFTSGTTSDPKAVKLRHRNMLAAYALGLECMGTPRRVGCVFRIATLGTLGIHFFFAQAAGATTVLLPKLSVLNARGFWAGHVAEEIDFFYLVPSQVKLLNHLATMPEHPASGQAVSAGAPLPVSEQDRFHNCFGLPLRNIYGLTEAGFASFFGRIQDGRGTPDIGPAKGLEARVMDENGQVLGPEAVGELFYRGPMVADGYLGNSQATEATFPDGWLATGDLVKCDARGNYSIVGRKKNVILRGGFTIYPAEVEEAIEALEGVFCAVVFARENDVKGEEICAYVACRTEQDAAARNALIAAVRKDLGAFRAPDRFHFTTHAPATNSAGKIRIESLLAYFDDQAPVPLVGGVS